MKTERLKSLAVISLFISATLLAGVKFNFFVNFQRETDFQISTISLNEVYKENIKPAKLIATLGNGNKTVIYNQNNQYYEEARQIIKAALEQNNELIEVELGRYKEQQNLKSLEIKFDTPINSRLLSRSLFLNVNKLEALDDIKSILIPLVDDPSIYIQTITTTLRQPLTSRTTLNTIDALTNYTKYYSLQELYNIQSNALINLEKPQNQSLYSTTAKITQTEIKDQIAQYLLGAKYDFTIKVSEFGGGTSYTYNFGQEYIKFKTSGAIEYINLDTGKETENNFDKSLETASNFLSTLEFDLGSLKIDSITQSTIQGKTGYTITYLQIIDGYEVYPSIQNQKITIQLIGNKIYSFKGLNRQSLGASTLGQTLTPVEVIELNYGMLQIGYGFETGEELLNLIQNIKQVYHIDSSYNLRACYQMQIGTRTFYFDIQTGNEVRNGLV